MSEGCGRKIGEFDCCTVVEGDAETISLPRAELVLTDPPYGISYSSCGGPRVSAARKSLIATETRLVNDVVCDWKELFNRVSITEDGAMYCFSAMKNYCDTVRWMSSFRLKTPIVWDKGNCGMGDLRGDYGCQTEMIIYGVRGRHILRGGRDRNIVRFQRPPDAFRFHPTEKPISLLEYIIRRSSNDSQLVLDPFCGSGSTLVAAKRLGRHFLGVEIEPKYVTIARERLAAEPWKVEVVCESVDSEVSL